MSESYDREAHLRYMATPEYKARVQEIMRELAEKSLISKYVLPAGALREKDAGDG